MKDGSRYSKLLQSNKNNTVTMENLQGTNDLGYFHYSKDFKMLV